MWNQTNRKATNFEFRKTKLALAIANVASQHDYVIESNKPESSDEDQSKQEPVKQ